MFLLLRMPEVAARYAGSIKYHRFDDPFVMAACGFVSYFTREYASAEETFEISKTVDNTNWLVYLGLTLVYLATERLGEAIDAYVTMSYLVGPVSPPMPGLGLYALIKSKRPWSDFPTEKIEQWPVFLTEPEETRDYLQTALSLMATDLDNAVISVSVSVSRGEPLAQLIPICPLFDPLRGHPIFQQIIETFPFPRSQFAWAEPVLTSTLTHS